MLGCKGGVFSCFLVVEAILQRYIKEWVHGDLGRTKPSLSTIIGCACTFLSLDVFDVRMPENLHELEGKQNDDDDDE